jgi:hypothetical protein
MKQKPRNILAKYKELLGDDEIERISNKAKNFSVFVSFYLPI